MPLAFGANFVEGKVYRGRKKHDEDEETLAIKEIQSILSNKSRQACDCEAQIHDLLENCMNCGRLTCSAEGPGKCLHCGNIVLSHDQRDRLQKHIDIFQAIPAPSSSQPSQSTAAQSNPFDHFTIDKMKHLSEDERRRLREDLDELEALKHKRKLMLDLDLENAEVNLRSEPVIDDYEAELRRLQLSHQPTEAESSMILSELVAAESKKKYNLIYIESEKDKKKGKSSSEQKAKNGENPKPKQKNRLRQQTNPTDKVKTETQTESREHNDHQQGNPTNAPPQARTSKKPPGRRKNHANKTSNK